MGRSLLPSTVTLTYMTMRLSRSSRLVAEAAKGMSISSVLSKMSLTSSVTYSIT